MWCLNALISSAPLVFLLFLFGQQSSIVRAVDLSNRDIQSLADDFWALDDQFDPGDVQVDMQGRTGISDRRDKASRPFYKNVNRQKLRSRSIRALIDLFDEFNPQTGVTESEKESEINEFLNAVLATDVMTHFRDFMKKKGFRDATSESNFKKYLKHLWFGQYSRARGRKDSSGFEHVFMGEYKNGEVSGMHNWIRAYEWERAGDLDYQGYIFRSNDFVSIQVNSKGNVKPGASFLMRRSPEYDLAIYTMCYIARRGRKRCHFTLPDCTEIKVTTFELTQNGNTYLGTAYPEGHRPSRDCRARNPSKPSAFLPQTSSPSKKTPTSAADSRRDKSDPWGTNKKNKEGNKQDDGSKSSKKANGALTWTNNNKLSSNIHSNILIATLTILLTTAILN